MMNVKLTDERRNQLTIQEGDIYLYPDLSGSDLLFINGLLSMDQTFDTAVQLSLFGGNIDDDGLTDNENIYWGNYMEPDSNRHYRSQTQYVLSRIPPTEKNLLIIEDANKADLQWFLDLNIATEVDSEACFVEDNQIHMVITIVAEGEERQFEFIENWKALQ